MLKQEWTQTFVISSSKVIPVEPWICRRENMSRGIIMQRWNIIYNWKVMSCDYKKTTSHINLVVAQLSYYYTQILSLVDNWKEKLCLHPVPPIGSHFLLVFHRPLSLKPHLDISSPFIHSNYQLTHYRLSLHHGLFALLEASIPYVWIRKRNTIKTKARKTPKKCLCFPSVNSWLF